VARSGCFSPNRLRLISRFCVRLGSAAAQSSFFEQKPSPDCLTKPLLPILEGVSQNQLGSCAVFVDSQNHASILDAVRLAKPDKTYVYLSPFPKSWSYCWWGTAIR